MKCHTKKDCNFEWTRGMITIINNYFNARVDMQVLYQGRHCQICLKSVSYPNFVLMMKLSFI